MSTLARPWLRWAVAAPAGSFVIAAFVLAPGGVPAIGIPAALEVGAGGVASSSPSVASTDARAGVVPRSTTSPNGATTAQHPGTLPRTGTGVGVGSHPRTVASPSGGVTIVSAQQPVVVTTGAEPGDDDSQRPTSSPSPTPSATGSWGGGPGDE